MSYLLPGCPSAIYLFRYVVCNSDEAKAKRELISIINRCEHFAKAIHIHFHDDFYFYIDNQASTRLVFNIKEPQDSILLKVPSLFAFAASLKLHLINHDFLTK
jgi:hypothetical protein